MDFDSFVLDSRQSPSFSLFGPDDDGDGEDFRASSRRIKMKRSGLPLISSAEPRALDEFSSTALPSSIPETLSSRMSDHFASFSQEPFSRTSLPLSSTVPPMSSGLRSISEIPVAYRSVFGSFSHFNYVQSKVLDDVLYTDKPMIVSAPTGSGKTAIFELAVIRLLLNSERDHSFKVVYMAPVKALCSQRCDDWEQKFSPFGLSCRELTGDSEIENFFDLQAVDIILTTPEKWDSMTRRWKDNQALVQKIRLFLIDEVHLLNDNSRGPTMEAVVSRMKTMQVSMRADSSRDGRAPPLRFLAVSATFPNVADVAEWLSSPGYPAACYSIGEEYRPVKLKKIVLGYHHNESSSTDFKFDISLNYKLVSVIEQYCEHKPTLVFCGTRRGTQQAANILANDARFLMSSQQKTRLLRSSHSVRDSKLKETVRKGVAYHHAGLELTDRRLVEELFIQGELPVLVATSTLAMGVNLPAHLVVIKSTQYYVSGVCVEYSTTQVLQMIGRAGRPQFDDSATAVIMTKRSTKVNFSISKLH
eukprot:m.56772 g.56772  ORF g.56772 m.56772 type:complete len:531 (+) comp34651_c0_seq4:65-1657(+)